MGDYYSTLASKLEPHLRRRLKPGNTTIVNNYITQGGGGGPVDLSWVAPKSRLLTAGDGLQGGGDLSADRTFAVDSTVVRTSRTLTGGNGIGAIGDLSANRTIAVSLAANPGLEFAGGALRMGQPTNVTATSGNSVSSANHTHGVTASADVGTTPVESLLKSTPTGGLTLKSLTVKGNVNVTDGGDLTVGANVLFVDVSLGSIGVNCAPDQQFAVDVNGPLRATYLIGKHAIQLDHSLLLCHFDSFPGSYRGDFNGLSGKIGRTTGAYFLPAKFDTGLARPNATTNYARNSSFEYDAIGATTQTGWSQFQSGAGAT